MGKKKDAKRAMKKAGIIEGAKRLFRNAVSSFGRSTPTPTPPKSDLSRYMERSEQNPVITRQVHDVIVNPKTPFMVRAEHIHNALLGGNPSDRSLLQNNPELRPHFEAFQARFGPKIMTGQDHANEAARVATKLFGQFGPEGRAEGATAHTAKAFPFAIWPHNGGTRKAEEHSEW